VIQVTDQTQAVRVIAIQHVTNKVGRELIGDIAVGVSRHIAVHVTQVAILIVAATDMFVLAVMLPRIHRAHVIHMSNVHAMGLVMVNQLVVHVIVPVILSQERVLVIINAMGIHHVAHATGVMHIYNARAIKHVIQNHVLNVITHNTRVYRYRRVL
jgi:hypothetical protein